MTLLRAQLNQQFSIRPGDGRPPQSWMATALPKRINSDSLIAEENDQSGYGNPLGHGALREMIARRFAIHGVSVNPRQIVTTFGANHALDLIIRCFLSAGQTVLIDDPGYYPLLAKLRLAKIKIIAVPRTQNGTDLEALQRLAETHRPEMFFTQSTAHNPTGSCYDLQTAHTTLKIAAQYDFKIVDDDPFIDLHGNGVTGTRLWELDGFQSVIGVGSYSKLLSASFRSGYVTAAPEIVEALTNLKIVQVVNSSRMSEMLIASMFRSGRYDQHIKKLAKRLAEARSECLKIFSDSNVTLFCPEPTGFYTLINLPDWVTLDAAQSLARRHSVFIAPGKYFFVSNHSALPVSMRVNFGRTANRKFAAFLTDLCTR